jgi:hypothetical protein
VFARPAMQETAQEAIRLDRRDPDKPPRARRRPRRTESRP